VAPEAARLEAVLPIVVAQFEAVQQFEVVPPIVAVRSSAVEPL
jgi:hypothetical protein